MVTQESGDSQAKIKVRLEILPKEASPDPKQIRITENIEISFSIKVSHKNSK